MAYFHYCNKGLHPFTAECKRSDLQTLAKLDEEAIRYVESTRVYVEKYSKFMSSCPAMSDQTAASMAQCSVLIMPHVIERNWELMREDGFDNSTEPGAHERRAEAYVDDYFFVSMLYQTNWSPQDSIIDKTAFRIIGPTRDTGRSSPK